MSFHAFMCIPINAHYKNHSHQLEALSWSDPIPPMKGQTPKSDPTTLDQLLATISPTNNSNEQNSK